MSAEDIAQKLRSADGFADWWHDAYWAARATVKSAGESIAEAEVEAREALEDQIEEWVRRLCQVDEVDPATLAQVYDILWADVA